MRYKLVIFDRDGTLNIRTKNGYVLREDLMIPASDIEVLKLIHNTKIAVASNQSCINKGLITQQEVKEMTFRFYRKHVGTDLFNVFICPHLESENCICRKPNNYLISNALLEANVSVQEAVFVGDSKVDLLAAESTGITFLPVCWDGECFLPDCVHTLTNVIGKIK